ncbi:optic atrophy 3 protein homolog [Dendronephthya gigantea]|uniref:optic atrophy 3 protein homolog n=1 Tax=Dendronephthya gigantea TaxID=151771 RepID=UPI00106BDE39|nr:optic atrophy 3 protein homolog [Dendronephthya gigantea]
MVAPFPLAKLLTLVMRQTAKPVAKGIKSLARKNAVFRKYVCVLPAQTYHWMEMSVKMRFLGHKGIPEIKPLNERSAVELGAEALGEAIVLSICMALICVEYRRGKLKEAKKEQARLDENASLKRQVQDLGLKIDTLAAEFTGNMNKSSLQTLDNVNAQQKK